MPGKGKERKEMENATIKVAGMRCDKCASFVEGELKKLPGTCDVSVSYNDSEARLSYDPALVDIDDIMAAITNEEKGFSVG